MKGKPRSWGGWRLLAVGLIAVLGLSVFGSWLLVNPPAASAVSSPVTYTYLVGSGFLCGLGGCPDVAMAATGDTITLSGEGTLSLHPDAVTGGGSFSGAAVGTGTWTAEQLVSFVSYGSAAPPFPPSLTGGKALVRIHLAPAGGGAGVDGVLRITCLFGSPPPSADEGIRLAVQGGPNFNREVSGFTVFILL